MSKDYNEALRTIAKGAGIAFIGIILSRFLAFLNKVLIARLLTPAEYGLLNLGLAVFSIFVLLSLAGMTDGLTRYIPYYQCKNDPCKVKGVIYSALRIALLLSSTFLLILFYSSDYLAVKVFNNIKLGVILKILSFALPFWVISRIFMSSCIGFKRIDYRIVIETLHNSIKLSIVLVLLYTGYGILGVVFGYLITFFLTLLIAYLFLRKLFSFGLYKARLVDKELLSYSWPLLLASFSFVILSWTDTLMLGYYTTESWVGIYNAAINASEIINYVGASISSLFLPVISEFYSAKDFKSLKQIYKTVTKWIFGISFPLLLLYLFFSEWIIKILFGPSYIFGWLALFVLALGRFVRQLLLPSGYIIRAIGRTKIVMAVSWVSAITNIILNVILIPYYGIVGAAIATTISIFFASVFDLIYTYRLVNVNPFSIKMCICSLAAIISLAILYLPTKLIISFSLIVLLPIMFIYFIIYFLLLLIFRFFEYNDIIILKSVESRIGPKLTLLRRVITKFL